MKNKYILVLLLIILISIITNNVLADTAAVSIATNLGMSAVSSSATTVVDENKILPDYHFLDTEDLCKLIEGCYTNVFEGILYHCYTKGTIINNTYCSGIPQSQNPSGKGNYKYFFTNQSDANEVCVYHYECKSNFCFNNKCVNNIESEMTKLNEEIETLKLLISKLEKNIELMNEPESINNSTKEKEENTLEQKNYLGLFRKLLNFK